MSVPTFTPPRDPSIPAQKSTTFRVLEASFGDGYVQRAADGLNAATVAWNLSWDNVPSSDADAIEAFFVARGGWQGFHYAVPTDVERTYRNGPVSRAIDKYSGLASISVTLTEVHDP